MLTFKEFQQEQWGRLGNQLFQIAALVGLGEQYNHQVILPSWKYSEYFNLLGIELDLAIIDKPTEMVLEYPWQSGYNSFKGKSLSLFNQNEIIDVRGHLQDSRYFEYCLSKILNDILSFKPEFVMKVKCLFPDLSEMCSIHVRRGDYLNYFNAFPLLPKIYYKEAVKFITEQTGCSHFSVFSDDIAWCEKQFRDIPGYFYYSKERSDIEDLWGMSQCKYHIISNSTFAWWGGFLGQSKLVIVPPFWLQHTLSYVLDEYVYSGLLSLSNMVFLNEAAGKIKFFSFLENRTKRWELILSRKIHQGINKLSKKLNRT